MNHIGLEIALIVLLVVANGVFAMAEMAVVSSRKARLKQRSEEGSAGAAIALELADNPHDFLSTVQIGITMIGTLAGAFGGATIAEKLAAYLGRFPQAAEYAESLSITVVVVAISYLSLILGELVPKSVALGNPEKIAGVLAPPMKWLSKLGSPAVRFLSFSTRIVLKILPVRPNKEAPITEEEIKMMIAQGAEHGTFEEAEQEMVEGVFRLGDRRAAELMTPRGNVEWLDVEDSWEANREVIAESAYSRFPVVDGDLDRVIGVVHVKELFLSLQSGEPPELRKLARPALFVPELMPALDILERFQTSGEQMAVVVDEHGGVEGVATLTDLLEAVVGDLRQPGEALRERILRRDDGSWLVDGSLPISDLVEELDLDEDLVRRGGFNTVGGFILAHLRRIPSAGDSFVAGGWQFEVVDMDRNRIDKVLVTPMNEADA